MIRRRLLGGLAALPLLLAATVGVRAEERVVNIYNWSDYIDPKVLDDFTKETGIKVVYDTYDNNEILETKLLAGKSGYDVVVPSGPFLQRLIRAGIFLPLDKAKIPNLKHAWPEITGRLQAYDPGNTYAVDYMWGTTGIGVNLGAVRERLGANAALNSWSLVLNPSSMAKLKDCGVMLLDSPEDLIPSILRSTATRRIRSAGTTSPPSPTRSTRSAVRSENSTPRNTSMVLPTAISASRSAIPAT